MFIFFAFFLLLFLGFFLELLLFGLFDFFFLRRDDVSLSSKVIEKKMVNVLLKLVEGLKPDQLFDAEWL